MTTVNTIRNPLSCLVMASDTTLRNRVSHWLGVSRRIGRLELVADHVALRQQLTMFEYDLTILVADAAVPILPACLLRYPDLRVLVLTRPNDSSAYHPSRGHEPPAPLSSWLQQGANDVADLAQEAEVQHAISRMIDECALVQQRRELCEQIGEQKGMLDALSGQQKTIDVMIDQHPDLVALWRHGSVIRCNAAFRNWVLQPHTDPASVDLETLSQSCFKKLSAASRAGVRELLQRPDGALSCAVSSTEGEQVHALSMSTVIYEQQPARLVQISAKPVATQSLPDLATDSVTGLPARQAVRQHLQRWLRSGRSSMGRVTAVRVQLKTSSDAHGGTSGAERTLQDLTVYRAANALQESFAADGLMGRFNQDSLVLFRAAGIQESTRETADRVRKVLGSLGGLIETPADLRINTLNLGRSSLSADQLMQRLDRFSD